MSNTTTIPNRKRRMAREPQQPADVQPTAVTNAPAEVEAAPAEKRPSKTRNVLALLQREAGATLHELVEATGWLPHTTRAALTGLKKKGHTIERTKVEGVSRYAVIASAAQ